MKVFISGPMKGYPNFNKEAFDQAEKELVQQGYTVFNPAWMDFSGEWTKQDKRAIDAAIMSRCDAVYQLPGWDGLENGGSRMECVFAQGAAMIFLEKDADGFFFAINKENREILGNYIKRLTDKGYKLSFENPIGEIDWISIKISKDDLSMKVTISPHDISKSVLPIENMLIKTIENIVGKRVLKS